MMTNYKVCGIKVKIEEIIFYITGAAQHGQPHRGGPHPQRRGGRSWGAAQLQLGRAAAAGHQRRHGPQRGRRVRAVPGRRAGA